MSVVLAKAAVVNMLLEHVFPSIPSLTGCPASREGDVLLLAICLQESGGAARAQTNGPARGFWMFEPNGVSAVLTHPRSRDRAAALVRSLGYTYTTSPTALVEALEHNDLLAAGFARLLLWTDLRRLPKLPSEKDLGWALYVDNWRPGKPRQDDWSVSWNTAWALA